MPPADADGNFIIGPTHAPAPEMTVQDGVPQGDGPQVHDELGGQQDLSRHRARAGHVRHARSRTTPRSSIVTTSRPAPYTRRVAVYVPKQYVPGTAAPFIVGADGPDQLLFTALDNLIAQKRVPAMIAISIGNGSGDAQGSQRGLEYDTMSGRYAEFVETEVLPLVEKQCNVKLTKDPDGRATMGCSSGASAALIMAWYRTDLYHRVLSYSGTFVNQQWPCESRDARRRVGVPPQADPQQPGEADAHLDARRRPRPAQPEHHARRHARLGAGQRAHGQGAGRQGLPLPVRLRAQRRPLRRAVKQQTLPNALEWLWKGYTSRAASAK